MSLKHLLSWSDGDPKTLIFSRIIGNEVRVVAEYVDKDGFALLARYPEGQPSDPANCRCEGLLQDGTAREWVLARFKELPHSVTSEAARRGYHPGLSAGEELFS